MLRADERSSRAFASVHRPQCLTKDGFLRLIFRPVERIGLRQRQLKRALMIAEQPGMADELTRIADRSEPLIVEIVGESVAGQSRDFGRRSAKVILGSGRGGQWRSDCRESAAGHRDATIAPAARARSSDALDGLGRPIGDGQILDCDGVPVFQTAHS